MKKVISLVLTCVLLLSVLSPAVGAAEKPIPGYYVVGTMNNWTLDKDYLMTPSYFGTHYELLQISLNAGDEFKVVYSDDGIKKTTWYPAGVDNNYIVQETSSWYNIELAPDYDGIGEEWYCGCIYAMPCTPPIGDPYEPTPPDPVDLTKKLWEQGTELTAEDIEEAANEQYGSRTYFCADKIKLRSAYRFNCTPAYAVDYEVEGYGFYACVILNEKLGDYLLYSTSSFEPSVFVNNQLYTFTKAYEKGFLTNEMLAELVEAEYSCGDYGRCRIVTRYVKGDADGDGEANIIDATVIQRYDLSLLESTDIYKPLADVDEDGNVNIIDATRVQRYDLGLCSF